MYRYEDLANAGVFNMTDPSESELAQPFYTETLLRDSQGHYRFIIPVHCCVTAEDMVGVWAEPIPDTKFIRRIFQIFPPHEVEKLTPEAKSYINLRKVYPNFSKKDHRMTVFLPMGKIKAPLLKSSTEKARWNWTHLRLHITKHPNKYWMEFLDLRRPEPETNQIEEVREDKIFRAYEPNKTTIRWD